VSGEVNRVKFRYEDMSDDQFERLIVLLCQELLGISTQGFAKGPDGGRDAKFVGTAELHPSKVSPWTGTTIIQAKHTNGINKSFSEPDFFSKKSQETVLGKEIPRIRKLRAQGQMDHYMLFSNRRLAGNAESEIRKLISVECNIPEPSIYLCGLEQLELLLKRFPEVSQLADLDPVDSPLLVSPDDLSDVVQALAGWKNEVRGVVDDPPVPRLPYDQKNKINDMSDEYAKELRKRYLKDTAQIQAFLAAPENYELLQQYEAVVDEFQFKVIANRKDFQSFDKVMEYLKDLLFERDPVLRQHKRLTRAMLFYMYWNCDLGDVGDAETN
jgi:hypothetical protein